MTTSYPSHLFYTKEHEWIHIQGAKARVGVTAYALEQLGDVVYLELPAVGTRVQAHAPFGTIESTKTVSDLYMPVSGQIEAVNQSIVDDPAALMKDMYEQGWLVEVELASGSSAEQLMDAQQYADYIASSQS